jgi:hypothetical protein
MILSKRDRMPPPVIASKNKKPNLPKEEPAIPLEPDVAAARSIFINDNIRIVKSLKEKGKTAEEAAKEVPVFCRDYPALFKMLFKIDIGNEAALRTMLAMLDRMGRGEMTQDQASGVIGQRLYDTYIKPNLDETKEQ